MPPPIDDARLGGARGGHCGGVGASWASRCASSTMRSADRSDIGRTPSRLRMCALAARPGQHASRVRRATGHGADSGAGSMFPAVVSGPRMAASVERLTPVDADTVDRVQTHVGDERSGPHAEVDLRDVRCPRRGAGCGATDASAGLRDPRLRVEELRRMLRHRSELTRKARGYLRGPSQLVPRRGVGVHHGPRARCSFRPPSTR